MTNELKKLKQYLPKGYTLTLAKEFGVTNVTVSNSLCGKNKRFDIIQRAVEMAKETIKTKAELTEAIAELEGQV
jgi:hypothetical protein